MIDARHTIGAIAVLATSLLADSMTSSSSAADTLALAVSENAYRGDAQFTAAIDGKQLGGIYTVSALFGCDMSNLFTWSGGWGTGSHTVQVSFLNDAWDGVPNSANDRNLRIDNIAYDGQTYANTTFNQNSAGTATFSVGGNNPKTAPAPDRVTLHIAEDAYQGNAQFTVSVDGKQVSTPQDATVLHSSGKWQDVSFAGKLGAGKHTIAVTFTNDRYGGSPTADRNLYVNGIDVNGTHYGSRVTTLHSNGAATYSVTGAN
jgi:hypothetical protein